MKCPCGQTGVKSGTICPRCGGRPYSGRDAIKIVKR